MDWFNGFVVPGRWAREYVLHFSTSAQNKPILMLPNIVDERRFRDGVAERRQSRQALLERWGLGDSKPIFLTVARLEPIKGVQQLVEALLTFATVEQITLLIAGGGSQSSKLEKIVRRSGFEQSIRLLGHLSESEILDMLALANAFVLPSLGDCYPLAAIEAAFAGLPLLLSDRVGCHPETLVPQHNGLLFNPYDSSSIQSCFDQFLRLESKQWIEMGRRSLELAEKHFGTQRAISRFVDELIKL
jgi:glycosyltransferase involved in cell wall biosynthesis